jgi:hypothetical protein
MDKDSDEKSNLQTNRRWHKKVKDKEDPVTGDF